jgi:uncharacterized protein
MDDDNDIVEVRIGALIMDPNTNTPIVVLKGVDSETVLPIWVGAFEANAIALEIEKVVPQRPMTHDLLRNLIVQCGLSAARVVVTDLRDNTFYAVVELRDDDGEPFTMDSRPSDAIALALRLDCPIFVRKSVLEMSATSNPLDRSTRKPKPTNPAPRPRTGRN